MLISKFKKDEDVVNIHDLQELIGLKLPSVQSKQKKSPEQFSAIGSLFFSINS